MNQFGSQPWADWLYVLKLFWGIVDLDTNPTDSQTWPRSIWAREAWRYIAHNTIQYRTVVSAEWLKNRSTFPTRIITLRAAKTVWANGRHYQSIIILAWQWVANMSYKASQWLDKFFFLTYWSLGSWIMLDDDTIVFYWAALLLNCICFIIDFFFFSQHCY